MKAPRCHVQRAFLATIPTSRGRIALVCLFPARHSQMGQVLQKAGFALDTKSCFIGSRQSSVGGYGRNAAFAEEIIVIDGIQDPLRISTVGEIYPFALGKVG
uniref:Uncharacterized protein n=1 Tax=Candidatus Kentrum sp. LFY TaxID=2126342 RepID=A0A450UQ48_9GAMM|nr:MAG: hypothetical protein BECKLFY1418B_GA0070995_106114 [Candidatus Kentron sp. LFY]